MIRGCQVFTQRNLKDALSKFTCFGNSCDFSRLTQFSRFKASRYFFPLSIETRLKEMSQRSLKVKGRLRLKLN